MPGPPTTEQNRRSRKMYCSAVADNWSHNSSGTCRTRRGVPNGLCQITDQRALKPCYLYCVVRGRSEQGNHTTNRQCPDHSNDEFQEIVHEGVGSRLEEVSVIPMLTGSRSDLARKFFRIGPALAHGVLDSSSRRILYPATPPRYYHSTTTHDHSTTPLHHITTPPPLTQLSPSLLRLLFFKPIFKDQTTP